MDLVDFSKDAGIVLRHGLSSAVSFDKETKDAFERLYSDKDKRHAFEAMLAAAGLTVVRNMSDTSAAFLPQDSDSPFVMSLADVKKRLAGRNDRQVHVAFAVLAILATFYPNRESISFNDTNPVREEDVYATIRRIIDFAKEEKDAFGEDRLSSIAEDFDRMNDVGGGGQNASYKEYYVRTGFQLLEESGYVRGADKDGGRLPTEMMRMVVLHRMNDGSFKLAEILSRLHDAAEIAKDI